MADENDPFRGEPQKGGHGGGVTRSGTAGSAGKPRNPISEADAPTLGRAAGDEMDQVELRRLLEERQRVQRDDGKDGDLGR